MRYLTSPGSPTSMWTGLQFPITCRQPSLVFRKYSEMFVLFSGWTTLIGNCQVLQRTTRKVCILLVFNLHNISHSKWACKHLHEGKQKYFWMCLILGSKTQKINTNWCSRFRSIIYSSRTFIDAFSSLFQAEQIKDSFITVLLRPKINSTFLCI